MITGKIKQIETMGLVDGPGIRIVIFMQGCPLRCLFCHNPDMWSRHEGITYTPEQLVSIILKYKNYFGEDGGVTFSGGEPLFQPLFLKESLKLCKENGINTCLDTSGVGAENLVYEILSYADLVIFDVKALTKKGYMKMTNNSLDKSITFINLCKQMKKRLWIRNVIIPGINDNVQYIEKLSVFIKKLNYVDLVELLPYHTMGVDKYKKLGKVYPLENIAAMDKYKCEELQKKLEDLLKK